MGIGDGIAQGGTPGGGIVEGLAVPRSETAVEQTLTDAATVEYDVALGANAAVILGGDRVLNWTNPRPRQSGVIRIIQDGTPPRLITSYTLAGVAGDVDFAGGVVPTLTNAIDAVDLLVWYFDGTTVHVIVISLDSK